MANELDYDYQKGDSETDPLTGGPQGGDYGGGEAAPLGLGGEEPRGPAQEETMHPVLRAFASLIPDALGAKDWLASTATRLNNWVMARDVADRSQAHAEEYTKNVDTFKQGLVQMVQNDPTAVTVARDIVPETLKHLLPSNLSDEQHKELYNVLGSHVQNEVVEAAVRSMATRAPVLAARMLDSTVGDILSDDQKKGLTAYVHAQNLAQGADDQARQVMAEGDQARGVAVAGHGYASALVNPANGGAAFPPAWASRLIADPRLPPEEKNSLMGMYGRMQANGDAPESNGHTIYDALKRMKSGQLSSQDLWNAVGTGGKDGLTAKDATWLNGMMHSETPEGRANRDAFTNALEDAAGKLLGPSGLSGATGARNFNNYAKWLTGAYQQTGLAGLDPNHENYLFKNVSMNQFKDPGIVNNGVLQRAPGDQPEKAHVSSYFRTPRASRRRR